MRLALTSILAALPVAAVSLSACGRKGPLERPPQAKTADAQGAAVAAPDGPRRPFILDRLLQ